MSRLPVAEENITEENIYCATTSESPSPYTKLQSPKDRIAADSRANSLLRKDTRSFWKEIQKINNSKLSCPAQTIGDATGPQDICRMWHNHYSSLRSSSRVIMEERDC